ncbi:MAG: copper homeostasis protein CutC [Bacteroidales bacterium]|nr:copper homeostasis protein CutC [Bacteroidales bacterium]
MNIFREVMIKEACVESVQQAVMAEKQGAGRIELCSRLDLGGISPPIALVEEVLQSCDIPVRVMVRPRGGDFVFNRDEIALMMNYINTCKATGIEGFVTGALTPENQLDIPLIRQLVQEAAPLPVTIHKAIDESTDPLSGIESLKKIPGVTHILSSGKADTAIQGSVLLKEMIRAAADDLTILVAGRVTAQNLEEVHQLIRASEYHGRKIV